MLPEVEVAPILKPEIEQTGLEEGIGAELELEIDTIEDAMELEWIVLVLSDSDEDEIMTLLEEESSGDDVLLLIIMLEPSAECVSLIVLEVIMPADDVDVEVRADESGVDVADDIVKPDIDKSTTEVTDAVGVAISLVVDIVLLVEEVDVAFTSAPVDAGELDAIVKSVADTLDASTIDVRTALDVVFVYVGIASE